MIPILYEKTETAFINNGLCRLRDAISAIVTEERNGIYEMNFEYPVDGANFDLIQIGRIVGVTHDDTGNIQPFDIVSYSKPINGVVSFHCTHISYRQSYITMTGGSINDLNTALASCKHGTNLGNDGNPFTYWTNMVKSGYCAAIGIVPQTVRSVLGGVEGSILDTYGGEYEWDKFTVKLWSARGQLRDFTIRYGVNMLDYNEECDIQGTFSSCIPYWTSGEVTTVAPETQSGNQTITGRGECVPLDLSDKFEENPTQAQLQSAAVSYMASNKTYLPVQNIHVEFVRLQDMNEYAGFQNLLQCGLCDTINVVFPDYNSSGAFKIVQTVWNVLNDKYDSMELGDLSVSLSEALGIENGFGSNGSDSGIVDTYGAITGGTWSSKSIGTGSAWKELANFTIPEDGVWLLIAQLIYASNATGHRTMSIATSSASSGVGIYSDRRQAVNGTETQLRVVAVVQGNTKYYVNTYHGASSAISCQGRYTAFKIGNSVNKIGG